MRYEPIAKLLILGKSMILVTIFRASLLARLHQREHTRMGRRGGAAKIAAKSTILRGSGVLQLAQYVLFLTLVFKIVPLFGDSSAGYPPNPYEFAGGKRAPMFSEANAAAIHFLSIVDNQVYAGAWLEAGGLMHDTVPQQVWSAGMRVVRQGLGVVRARKVVSHRNINALPGGTQGEFMIITYRTQFAQKPNSVETVTLMMHPPLGLWQVISYSIL